MADRTPSRIVLVGFMGAGKTTVGSELARALGWSFTDLDALVESRCGRTVAQVFAERGEPAFREEERAAAAVALDGERRVIAAGGGAFAEARTRELLRSSAATVYLECDLETLLQRLPPDGSRPLLGNRETMRRLLLARDAWYRRADVTVDASRGTPAQLVFEIARALKLPLPG